MRVILDLKEETLKRLGSIADNEKRSRKNYMEFVLESSVENIQRPILQTDLVKAEKQEEKKESNKATPSETFFDKLRKNKLGF